MLKSNILAFNFIKSKKEKCIYRSNSSEQKEMILNSPELTLKANLAQKIYDRSILYLIIYILLSMLILLWNDTQLNQILSLLLTGIAFPMILSLNSISFELMKEIDNETIFDRTKIAVETENRTTSSNEKLLKTIEVLQENNDLLKLELEQQKMKNLIAQKSKRKFK
ncbi:hypothetical protein BH747_04120 [Enterococcus villorum]|uniref:Uncharacterized protein n=1 Tax=Enterococcus villorum TaxID=112904 RepID=A0A1V8YEZ7_9ENTE|nr:hypothetical protein [Enterococcus villorum]OQO71181.1 hypothetical protein BH747_04120 [Enterococcus villorum]OQO74989.1 hypothetical protein BH744_06290 [Enterococcus villorum]